MATIFRHHTSCSFHSCSFHSFPFQLPRDLLSIRETEIFTMVTLVVIQWKDSLSLLRFEDKSLAIGLFWRGIECKKGEIHNTLEMVEGRHKWQKQGRQVDNRVGSEQVTRRWTKRTRSNSCRKREENKWMHSECDDDDDHDGERRRKNEFQWMETRTRKPFDEDGRMWE